MTDDQAKPVVIGITTYGRDECGRFTLPAEYIDCVRRAGALALMLPPGEASPERWLDLIDAVVLTGGGDIDPVHWQASADGQNYGVDAERDATELDLARHVLTAALPSLWICRGLQLLNVVRAGSLHQHLEDVVGETVQHRLPPRETVLHSVQVEAGTQLARTLGATVVDVVSWHHQAIDRLGDGLRVIARAPDGVIEAVELAGSPELEAVQWHPELSAERDPVQQRLFDALVARARAFRQSTSR